LFAKEIEKSWLKQAVETILLSNVQVLTLTRRTLDWFILRKHTISGILSQKFARHDSKTAKLLKETDREVEIPKTEDVFRLMTESWYTVSKNGTSAVKLGGKNEDVFLRKLRQQNWVKEIFNVGLLEKTGTAYSVSADGICTLSLQHSFDSKFNLKFVDEYLVSGIEIKTKVSNILVDEFRQKSDRYNLGSDLLVVEVGTDNWFDLVPTNNRGQVLQQMMVTGLHACVFSVASLTVRDGSVEIFYSILVVGTQDQIAAYETGLSNVTRDLLDVFVERSKSPDWNDIAIDTDETDLDKARSHYAFWRSYKEQVIEHDFLFNAGVERCIDGIPQYCNKTKGGLDGNSALTVNASYLHNMNT